MRLKPNIKPRRWVLGSLRYEEISDLLKANGAPSLRADLMVRMIPMTKNPKPRRPVTIPGAA
jgi:hypothetical protein